VQHCTPEQLALAALSEPLPPEDAEHLASCERCRAEVASLRRGVEALAVPQLAAPGPGVPPPPGVWDAIAAATGVSSAPRAEATATPPAAAPAAPAPPAGPDADVIRLRPRRRSWLILGVAAAVAGAAVGAGAVALLQRDDAGTPVAAATLDPLEGQDASGEAEVVERNGQRLLEVQLSAPELDGAYYEVWLLQPSVEGLVPLGVAQPGTATFEIPAGLDLTEYPLVDVSVEPLDGDPAHSGDSVVRGELDA
jgi:hypothetical protein